MAMTLVVVKTSQLASTNTQQHCQSWIIPKFIRSLPYGEPQSSPKWVIVYTEGFTPTPHVSAASESDLLQGLTLTQQAGM